MISYIKQFKERTNMREIMVSGYGGGEAASISKYRVSDDWSVIEEIWHDNIESPSYLSIDKDMCFAIMEKEETGALLCYKKGTKGYTLMDKMIFEGGGLCFIYYSSKHKTLYGAYYHTGHVLAVAVKDYKFAGIRNFFIMQPNHNEGITRAHCCVPDRDEVRLFVCNIALDRVYGYNIENGTLKENDEFPYIQLEKGEGPRHIRFHPQMNIAYVITEYSNKLITMSYDRVTGVFNVIQKVSTLPELFLGKSFCSTLTFSPDGKYLYAANRGANTICVFGISKEGLLKKLQDFDCCGDWPRHIDITVDGRFLMIANQVSGGVAVISISEKDGRLENHVLNIPFKAPGYVVEII
jgi:6-phosphogluconolactonase